MTSSVVTPSTSRGFAQDSYCQNSMRALTDRQTVKHVGGIGSFEAWWEQLLGQLEIVANDLYAFITDAQEITLDLREVPFDVETFYTLLSFPEYLATRAASDARAEAADPFEIDMWTLHSGATHALTHFYTGKEGTSLDQYVRTANDMLFNPQATLERITDEYKRQAAAETGAMDRLGSEVRWRWHRSSGWSGMFERKPRSSNSGKRRYESDSLRLRNSSLEHS